MSEKYNEDALKDFVAWVKYRKPLGGDITDESLAYVAQGIEQFLKGETPWKKPKGNKPNPDLMWLIFWHCYFNQEYPELLSKRHKEENGLYETVGKKLNRSADAIESLYRKGLEKFQTSEGKIEFCSWFAKHKGLAMVRISPKKSE